MFLGVRSWNAGSFSRSTTIHDLRGDEKQIQSVSQVAHRHQIGEFAF